MTSPIPFLDLKAGTAEVRDELDAAWKTTVDNCAFIGGAAVESFEHAFARYTASTHCIGVANGTDALELILAGLGVGVGDEVIVPANTFIATAEAVSHCGAKVVFADIDRETALLNADTVRAVMSPRTVAVLAVHLYGQPVDVDELTTVTGPAGVAIIEDAAQAHGATLRGRPVGSLGVAAGFSFYPGKNLGALGDGGAVTTSDPQLAERIRVIANHGRALDSKYDHVLLGRNSRLDGLQAAALEVKLHRLDDANEGRRAAAKSYEASLPDGFTALTERDDVSAVYHLYIVRCMAESRDTTTSRLDSGGIGWGLHYPVPCHHHEPFSRARRADLSVTEELADQILSLPMFPSLDGESIGRVCEVLGADNQSS